MEGWTFKWEKQKEKGKIKKGKDERLNEKRKNKREK